MDAVISKLLPILRSKQCKKALFFLGIAALIMSALVSLRPAPFLKFGLVGIFVFNALGAGSLLNLTLVPHYNLLALAVISSCGMALNDSLSWIIGRSGEAVIPASPKVTRLKDSITKYGVFALFFWSLIPFPYDLVGILAGYIGMPYKRYILPTFLGKFVRVLLVGSGILKILSLY